MPLTRISNGVIADNAVTGTKVASSAISTDKIATNAVSTDKIATEAVTANKIDTPYLMVVNNAGYSVPDGTSNIFYDILVQARGMSHNSNTNMIFNTPGKYLITTGWRFGSGGDVWTGVQLADSNGNIVARGYGTGQISNDPGPCQISFIADVTSAMVGTNMRMRFFRAGSGMGVGDPNDNAGYAIVTTVSWVGR
jgi:hypothetical protein